MRYSEIFFSLQGEGFFTGQPSIFLRLFGCNLRCPNFGQYDDKNLINPETYLNLKMDEIKSLNDLPIPEIGCDSSASWSKYTKQLSKVETPKEILKRIVGMIPTTMREMPHLVITGGEPLLQKNQTGLVKLIEMIDLMTDITEITFETNATQVLCEILEIVDTNINFTFSMSPKLSNSGEKYENRIKIKRIQEYIDFCDDSMYNSYLKFVVRDESQISEIHKITKQLSYDFNPIYLMTEGGTDNQIWANEVKIAELCLKYGFKFSDRLHCKLWGNAHSR